MSTVEEITAAIEQLPADQVGRIRAWLAEFAERQWDEQIERDERAGRLDALIDQALEERKAGRGGRDEAFAELRDAVEALSRNHYNGLLILLQKAAGMSVKDIKAWAKDHLE